MCLFKSKPFGFFNCALLFIVIYLFILTFYRTVFKMCVCVGGGCTCVSLNIINCLVIILKIQYVY